MSVFPDIAEERELTCWACPTQYQGRLMDGRRYYFRYRYGRARLGVGTTDDEAVADSSDCEGIVLGDDLDGSLDEDEFEAAAMLLLKMRNE